MLGYAPAAEHWIAAFIITACGWLTALLFYTVYRWRIVYWV
jgi:ABC-type polysaccharide/polyol phosphate export permease